MLRSLGFRPSEREADAQITDEHKVRPYVSDDANLS